MREQLQKEIRESMYVHMPLPLHEEKALESAYEGKPVTEKKALFTFEERPYIPECGEQTDLQVREEGILQISAPLRADQWPKGAPADGDYCNFGDAVVLFRIPREDWRGYNRLHFQVRPAVNGARVVYMNVGICNEGEVAVPDIYRREGDSMFHPRNGEWNDCYWEFEAMPRDCITAVKFYVNLTGRETCMDDRMTYEFRNIWLEKVENAEKEKGWESAKDRIVYSTAGYFTAGNKTALVSNPDIGVFTVVNADNGSDCYQGEVQWMQNKLGKFGILDFSDLEKEGNYYIKAGSLKSEVFPVGATIWEEPVWKALNFIFCERCGTVVWGKHQSCHLDMIARHNGLEMNFAGGWHDAGDISQQAVQTEEVVFALLEVMDRLPETDILRRRLAEEAQWGLDYCLRTRFGDGYRATSAGGTRITNGLAGDMDDIEVRVGNHSFDNFSFAAVEAYAACVLKSTDRELAWGSLRTAKEDYAFAVRDYEENGVCLTEMFEHTYNSSQAQYYALMSLSASCIYMACGEKNYALDAAKWAEKLLECQETGEASLPFTGFFYRDESHKEIVHFNHQSREHQFMRALILLCRTQPQHEKFTVWETAMKRYGEYLKYLWKLAQPYGMIPAGVYRMDEPEYEETFTHLHITAEYGVEKENYKKQLENGIHVDGMHVIRHFPVWFSFRGNNAVLLSQGKGAAMLGHYFADEELLRIGREQLYWIWGKNPFAQSLQYGVGERYGRQYAGFLGETAGEIPVGIETLGNEDIPYWPQNVNATYKEVWMSSAGRFLSLEAEYINFS